MRVIPHVCVLATVLVVRVHVAMRVYHVSCVRRAAVLAVAKGRAPSVASPLVAQKLGPLPPTAL